MVETFCRKELWRKDSSFLSYVWTVNSWIKRTRAKILFFILSDESESCSTCGKNRQDLSWLGKPATFSNQLISNRDLQSFDKLWKNSTLKNTSFMYCYRKISRGEYFMGRTSVTHASKVSPCYSVCWKVNKAVASSQS